MSKYSKTIKTTIIGIFIFLNSSNSFCNLYQSKLHLTFPVSYGLNFGEYGSSNNFEIGTSLDINFGNRFFFSPKIKIGLTKYYGGIDRYAAIGMGIGAFLLSRKNISLSISESHFPYISQFKYDDKIEYLLVNEFITDFNLILHLSNSINLILANGFCFQIQMYNIHNPYFRFIYQPAVISLGINLSKKNNRLE